MEYDSLHGDDEIEFVESISEFTQYSVRKDE